MLETPKALDTTCKNSKDVTMDNQQRFFQKAPNDYQEAT